MTQCFELHPLEEVVRDGQGNILDSGKRFILYGEAEDAFRKVVNRFGRVGFLFLGSLCDRYLDMHQASPWAIIAFEEEYQLAGHLLSIRQTIGDVGGSCYSSREDYDPERDGPPPLSIILVRTKEILGELAQKSPLLAPAWEALKDKPQEGHWLCISDPPPADWVESMAETDTDLFWEHVAPTWRSSVSGSTDVPD